MAKVSFTKLGLKLDQEIKNVNWNEQIIEIKQYLPIEKKLLLIMDVINNSEDNSYANPIKINVFTALKIIEYYTNINFTDKQKADFAKLYDLFNSTGLLALIIANIPKDELKEIEDGIEKSIKSFYAYKNSLMGIIDALSTDYNNTQFNLENIVDILNNDNFNMIKDIVPLMNSTKQD